MARFFVSVVLFFLFAFSPGKKDFVTDAIYTAVDTARIDSIVIQTEILLADQKSDRNFEKIFDCEDSDAGGFIKLFYRGPDVVLINVQECGTDHASSSFEAAFIDKRLVFYSESSGVWGFEAPAENDTTCCPTFDQTSSDTRYYRDGILIKEISGSETVHSLSKETESNVESFYYFDETGANVSELQKEIQQWIKFANSKKSYAAFFESNGK